MNENSATMIPLDSIEDLENDVQPSSHCPSASINEISLQSGTYDDLNLAFDFPEVPNAQYIAYDQLNSFYNFNNNFAMFDQVNASAPHNVPSSLIGNDYHEWQIHNSSYHVANFGTADMSLIHAPQVTQGYYSGPETNFLASIAPAHLQAAPSLPVLPSPQVTRSLDIYAPTSELLRDRRTDITPHGNPPVHANQSPPTSTVRAASVNTNASRSTRPGDGHRDDNERRSRPINWTEDRETLYQLYMVQSMTVKEVVDAMKLRGIQVERSTLQKKFIQPGWLEFKKNKSTFQHRVQLKDRTRAAASLPKEKAPRSMLIPTRTVYEPRMCPTPSRGSEPSFHQDSMLHAIERLVLGSFDQKRPGGSLLLQAERESDTWESLYNRCLGLASLCTQHIGGKFYLMWNEFVEDMNAALSASQGLALLVHFWRIGACLLEGLSSRVRVSHSSCFALFFWIFLCNVRTHFRGKRPELATIVECLLQVLKSSPRELKNTLGKGCVKTMGAIGDRTGIHHPFVLKMASATYQYWKNDYSSNTQPETRHMFIHAVDFTHPTPDRIAMLADYTLLQRHSNPEAAPTMAKFLRNMTLDCCKTAAQQGVLTYHSAARALAYSTEILAVSQLDPLLVHKPNVKERDQAFQDVSGVINILRQGDLQCRIRAAELSRKLAIWYKTYISPRASNSTNYRDQKQVTAVIMSQIGEAHILVPEGQSITAPLTPKKHHKQQPNQNSPNNRWRRKSAEKARVVFSMIKGEGIVHGIPDFNLEGGPNAVRLAKKKKEKGPAQTPSPRSPLERTCWHCGETFQSGNQLGRHTLLSSHGKSRF